MEDESYGNISDRFIYILDRVCHLCEFFEKPAQLDHYLYVLQPDYVYYLDTVGVAGPCYHRGCCRRRHHEYSVLVTLKKIHAIVAINEDKEDKHVNRKGGGK